MYLTLFTSPTCPCGRLDCACRLTPQTIRHTLAHLRAGRHPGTIHHCKYCLLCNCKQLGEKANRIDRHIERGRLGCEIIACYFVGIETQYVVFSGLLTLWAVVDFLKMVGELREIRVEMDDRRND